MPLDKYPKNDEQIIQWNNYIKFKENISIELLINKKKIKIMSTYKKYLRR